jgi:hypothetical protein
VFGFTKKQLLIVAVLLIVALKYKAQIVQLPVVGPLAA